MVRRYIPPSTPHTRTIGRHGAAVIVVVTWHPDAPATMTSGNRSSRRPQGAAGMTRRNVSPFGGYTLRVDTEWKWKVKDEIIEFFLILQAGLPIDDNCLFQKIEPFSEVKFKVSIM